MGANEKFDAAMHRWFDPVTESVCERFMHDCYMTDGVNTDQSRAEFDRWLAVVKAEAWDEGQDSVTLYQDIYGATMEYADNPYKDAP